MILRAKVKVTRTFSEALPGVLRNRGIMSFISGEQENTSLTRIPRKASSHLLGQKSQEPQSERGY